MKKVIIYALLVVFTAGSAFANNEESSVSKLVQHSFNKEFAGAKSVSWEALASKNIYHASFIYNGEKLNAYFNGEGSLLATGRYIKQENLPMLVAKGTSKDLSKYEVDEVIELVSGTETSYILRASNEKQKIYLQAFNDGTTSLLKKERKK